jgi:hypothetical protein
MRVSRWFTLLLFVAQVPLITGCWAKKWSGLAAGGIETCANRADEGPYCWGGTGKTTQKYPLDTLGMPAVAAFAPGSWQSCAVDPGGVVSCWNATSWPASAVGGLPAAKIIVKNSGTVGPAVVVGAHRSCSLGADDSIYCWGDNSTFEYGFRTCTEQPGPQRINLPTRSRVRKLAMGDHHTCALTTDDTLWCWGANKRGQLAVPESTNLECHEPHRPFSANNAIPSGKVMDVAAGTGFTCAVLQPAGTVKCWGGDNLDVITSGSPTAGGWGATDYPATVGSTGFTSIVAGSDHVCATGTISGFSGQTAWCWGANANGELGTGSAGPPSATPVRVIMPVGSAFEPLRPIVYLTAGHRHTCAMMESGQFGCWGDNASGQLTDGTLNSSPIAVWVPQP